MSKLCEASATWYRYKGYKPTENKDYLCCCLLTDFRGGNYSLEQIVLKFDVDKNRFDCNDGIAVLYWTECPVWPRILELDPYEVDG